MNLADFQAQWLDILLALQKDPSVSPLSSDVDQEIFHALSLPTAKAIAQMVEQGKISVLSGVLSPPLKALLPASLIESLAQRYARAFPQSTVIPAAQGVPQWLQWLMNQNEVLDIPFAKDLLAYEQATLKLCFYQLPRLPVLSHAKLAPWAGLWVGTPLLNELLKNVTHALEHQSHRSSPAGIASTKQGWLLYRRHGTEVKRLAIHWGLYEILGVLDGRHSWVYYLEQVCERYPELQAQREMLQHWWVWLEAEQLLSYY